MRVQHLQGARGQASLVKRSHGVFTGGEGMEKLGVQVWSLTCTERGK